MPPISPNGLSPRGGASVRWKRRCEPASRSRTALRPGSAPCVPVEIIELEKRLGERLGAPVKIDYRNEKGKLEIKFGSLEELERIYRSFTS